MIKKNYSREFKIKIAKMVTDSGLSVPLVAKELDLHVNVVHAWVRLYKNSPDCMSQEDEELEVFRLKIENKRLTAERDYLLKTIAVITADISYLPPS